VARPAQPGAAMPWTKLCYIVQGEQNVDQIETVDFEWSAVRRDLVFDINEVLIDGSPRDGLWETDSFLPPCPAGAALPDLRCPAGTYCPSPDVLSPVVCPTMSVSGRVIEEAVRAQRLAVLQCASGQR